MFRVRRGLQLLADCADEGTACGFAREQSLVAPRRNVTVYELRGTGAYGSTYAIYRDGRLRRAIPGVVRLTASHR